MMGCLYDDDDDGGGEEGSVYSKAGGELLPKTRGQW